MSLMTCPECLKNTYFMSQADEYTCYYCGYPFYESRENREKEQSAEKSDIKGRFWELFGFIVV